MRALVQAAQAIWCFIAEIVDVTNFVRLRLTVKDKNDSSIVPVAFYTDSRGLELGPSSVKNGFTVAILHAVHHGFLDLTVGIRHETRIALRVPHYPKPGPLVLTTSITDIPLAIECLAGP